MDSRIFSELFDTDPLEVFYKWLGRKNKVYRGLKTPPHDGTWDIWDPTRERF